MSEQFFRDPPSVELLQWLARGSLKQNLARAVRLWVWLRSLYGDETERLNLLDSFTYAQWRDAFFSLTHPKGEEVPRHNDFHCSCNKSVAQWLFNARTNIEEPEWRRQIEQHAGIEEKVLSEWLQKPLFSLTRRMLCGDLQALVQLQWLEYHHRQYHRVKLCPARPTGSHENFQDAKLRADELNFLPPDLAAIAHILSQEINGIQRFFLHVEYVIPKETIDKVDNFQEQLRQLWALSCVPPVLLIYRSAKLDRDIECIVYPVCIYYMQRATYLCAFGQNPQGEMNWRNYRLDRIQKLIPLSWTDAQIPQPLVQLYQRQNLPQPDYIQEEMAKAWGFDFYQNASVMLLRFDRIHDQRYIQGTVRHETFKRVSYREAKSLIKKLTHPTQQKILLEILGDRSSQDAYYTAIYREDDPNILMRLQAWRPFVEVILPWKLRQRMAADVAKEWQLYH
ncbi:MAG TPA: TIGR03985 family CRISPR-associated protein [Cyanobacteria bacterium UBA8553]|nr:TIGR03985 family CRISPR-associated protein [Cyanobacteria bacterium UBA8553]HAJ58666.1 TIGR03985 family CRISPR-associated protein [Cyanobacteria bacterium UBA8543]